MHTFTLLKLKQYNLTIISFFRFKSEIMPTALGQNQSKIHLNIKIDMSKQVADLVDK